jgi:hypothetical protein
MDKLLDIHYTEWYSDAIPRFSSPPQGGAEGSA